MRPTSAAVYGCFMNVCLQWYVEVVCMMCLCLISIDWLWSICVLLCARSLFVVRYSITDNITIDAYIHSQAHTLIVTYVTIDNTAAASPFSQMLELVWFHKTVALAERYYVTKAVISLNINQICRFTDEPLRTNISDSVLCIFYLWGVVFLARLGFFMREHTDTHMSIP
jgi:hypothetical protein